MCSTPSMPAVQSSQQKEVVAPTYADATVSKASTSERNRLSSLAGRDVKTSTRGLNDEAKTKKKSLLGD